jgi:hypothetical protein
MPLGLLIISALYLCTRRGTVYHVILGRKMSYFSSYRLGEVFVFFFFFLCFLISPDSRVQVSGLTWKEKKKSLLALLFPHPSTLGVALSDVASTPHSSHVGGGAWDSLVFILLSDSPHTSPRRRVSAEHLLILLLYSWRRVLLCC